MSDKSLDQSEPDKSSGANRGAKRRTGVHRNLGRLPRRKWSCAGLAPPDGIASQKAPRPGRVTAVMSPFLSRLRVQLSLGPGPA